MNKITNDIQLVTPSISYSCSLLGETRWRQHVPKISPARHFAKTVQLAAMSGFCRYIPEHHETAEIRNGNAAILFEVGEILYQLRSREGKPPQGLYLIGR